MKKEKGTKGMDGEVFNETLVVIHKIMQGMAIKGNYGKQIAPFLQVYLTGNNCAIIPVTEMPSNPDRKDLMFRSMGMLLKEKFPGKNIEAAYFISEAWVAKVKKEDWDGGSVSERPDKKEAAVIAGMTFKGRQNLSIAPILKDSTGEIYALGKADVHPAGKDADGESENKILTNFFFGFLTKTVSQVIEDRAQTVN